MHQQLQKGTTARNQIRPAASNFVTQDLFTFFRALCALREAKMDGASGDFLPIGRCTDLCSFSVFRSTVGTSSQPIEFV